jgi:hypothetical protein
LGLHLGDGGFEGGSMILVGGAEAEVDQVHVVVKTPVDSGEEGREIGDERVVKDFDGEEMGLRGALVDEGGYSGAVAEAVGVGGGVGVEAADWVDGYAAGYVADVGVVGVDAAVDYGDTDWPVGGRSRLSLRYGFSGI